jgi:hypothetical protein
LTCPDWTVLTAHRGERQGDEPAGWRDALAHLDGCPRCRRAALHADPTLVFRRLPAASAAAPVDAAAAATAVRQAVAAMRAASRHEERTLPWSGTRRWAAAVLALAALSVASDHGGRRIGALATATPAPRLAPRWPAGALAVPASEPGAPLVEELGRPGARVYQMDGDGLSVVMIVDENLDV